MRVRVQIFIMSLIVILSVYCLLPHLQGALSEGTEKPRPTWGAGGRAAGVIASVSSGLCDKEA
jgi:hypothetical protein